jgi:hypothetical protein
MAGELSLIHLRISTGPCYILMGVAEAWGWPGHRSPPPPGSASASRTLHEEVGALNPLLARVGDSLEPTKACPSDGLGLAKAQALVVTA